MNNNIELLAPGGNLEKLKMAVIYGADAVYIGGQKYGLRAGAGNFTMGEIKEGLAFAHDHGAKLFVTLNVIPHNEDIEGLDQYVKELNDIGIDAIIVADPGAFSIVKKVAPNMEIHISTQANNTNWATCNFWHNMGAKRVVMARELSFEEIKEIREKCPDTMEIEAFVHGAMCMSYSGRCLLSNYMTGRDANRGDCAQSCRWKYHLVEEKRPGEYMPVIEDEGGTYIFNSKDLCMIEHIPQILESGINSLKIEGRMKSSFYVATVVKAYREAIDKYLEAPESYSFDPHWLEEIQKASHRDFITGFYFNKPDHKSHIYDKGSYIRNFQFLGLVLRYDRANQIAIVEQRNRFFKGDEIEIVSPKGKPLRFTIEEMWDEEDNPIDVAPHPQQIVKIKIPYELNSFDMLRREKEDKGE